MGLFLKHLLLLFLFLGVCRSWLWIWRRCLPRACPRHARLLATFLSACWFGILVPKALAFMGVLNAPFLWGVPLLFVGLVTGLTLVQSTCGTLPNRERRQGALFAGEGAMDQIGLFCLFAIVLIGFVGSALRGVLLGPSGYDSLNYRLPTALWMLQEGSYAFPRTHLDIIGPYPRNMECFFAGVLGMTGSLRLVNLCQFFFVAPYGLGVYGLARLLNARAWYALAGTLAAMAVPVFFAQLKVAYVDIAMASFVICGFYFAIRAAREPAVLPWSLLLGMSLGLVLGTRYTGLIYVPFLLAFFLALSKWNRRLMAALALALAVLCLTGSETYPRNLLRHRNPLFPYHYRLLGGRIELPGPWDPEGGLGIPQTRHLRFFEKYAVSWFHPDSIRQVSHTGLWGGAGLTGPFLLLNVGVALVLGWRRHGWRSAWLVFPAGLLLALVTPLGFRVRYILFLLGIGGAAFAWMLQRVQGQRFWRGLVWAGALLAAFHALVFYLRTDVLPLRGLQPGLYDIVSFSRPRAFRGAYKWVREHVPAGATLFYATRNVNFTSALWRPDFANRVYYAEFENRSALEVFFQSRPGVFFFVPSQSVENAWAESLTALLDTPYRSEAVCVYRVKESRQE